MKNRYTFPAILSFDNDGITVNFLDLEGCITFGINEEEAIQNAKEALELHIYGLEQENAVINPPSKLKDINFSKGQITTLISIWMIPVRDQMQNKTIKKTLTIPKWLNDIAIENNVNFSLVLKSGLKKYLGIV